MDTFIATALIGLIATAGMTAFLWLVTGLKLADVDMVRAVGSLATRSQDKALLPGLLIHFVIGVVLSYFYAFFLQIPGLRAVISYAAAGTFIGSMHGIVVSIALVALVAEHHPVERFQKAGFQVAAYHVVAHTIYGFLVGLLHGLWFV